MFVRDVRLDSFVEDLLKVEDLPKNELARLFLAELDDRKDGGSRREALLRYHRFLATKKGKARLLRIKNRMDHEIVIPNADGHGSITLKPNKCITGIVEDNIFHMIEGFSTIQPRTLILPVGYISMFECTSLHSLSWSLH